MFDRDLDTLSAGQTLDHVSRLRADSERLETSILQTAAHWADLHGVLDRPADMRALPGMEQMVLLGGEGTPQVAEFCCAELGAELAISPYAAGVLIGDALDLRHRLPILWSRVQAGEVKPWIGRRIAQVSRSHDRTVAAQVDAKVSRWADRLTWARIQAMVDAAIIGADPERAEREAAERRRQHGVWVNRSHEFETATAFIRGDVVDLTFFDAALDRIADGIGLLGDNASKDVRRAKRSGSSPTPSTPSTSTPRPPLWHAPSTRPTYFAMSPTAEDSPKQTTTAPTTWAPTETPSLRSTGPPPPLRTHDPQPCSTSTSASKL